MVAILFHTYMNISNSNSFMFPQFIHCVCFISKLAAATLSGSPIPWSHSASNLGLSL